MKRMISICSRNAFNKASFAKNSFYRAFTRGFCTVDRFDFAKVLEKPIELKLEAKTEMTEEDGLIEFDEDTDWEKTVVNSEVPVVVDFYADWCGPCRTLKPKLVAAWHEQKDFRLVKINIDENEELAQKLNITSLPTVFLVYKGNVLKNFMGLPSDAKLKEFFEEISLVGGIKNDEKVFQSLLFGAEEFLKKDQPEQALNMLSEAASQKTFLDKYEHIVHVSSALVHYKLKKFDESREILSKILSKRKNEIDNNAVLRKKTVLLDLKLKLEEQPELKLGERLELEEKVRSNPEDLNTRYLLAIKYFEAEEFSACCNSLVEILAIDRNWEDKKANKLLFKVFDYLGSDDNLVKDTRGKLQKILY